MLPASSCCSPVLSLHSAGTLLCRASICATTSALRSFSTSPSCSLAAASLSRNWLAAGKRERRTGRTPPSSIPASKDAEIVRAANQDGATLLGYNVHKEPWLWPDIGAHEAWRHCGRDRRGQVHFPRKHHRSGSEAALRRAQDADDYLRRQGRSGVPGPPVAAYRGRRTVAGSARDRSNEPYGVGAIQPLLRLDDAPIRSM